MSARTLLFLLSTVSFGADLDQRFTETIRPFLQTHCIGCHGGEKPAAQLDLRGYSNLASVIKDYRHWALVLERLNAKEMPPKGAKQPADEDRQKVIEWIEAVRKEERARPRAIRGSCWPAGSAMRVQLHDPRPDRVDIRPTREFPVDPANPAGFDNSGESLSMSPALLNKYLQAAREVANHMVLKPSGTTSRHIWCCGDGRDKYVVQNSSTLPAAEYRLRRLLPHGLAV